MHGHSLQLGALFQDTPKLGAKTGSRRVPSSELKGFHTKTAGFSIMNNFYHQSWSANSEYPLFSDKMF